MFFFFIRKLLSIEIPVKYIQHKNLVPIFATNNRNFYYKCLILFVIL